MTGTEDHFHVTCDGFHTVKPGSDHVCFTLDGVFHVLEPFEALRLGDTLVMAGSRALSAATITHHGHHTEPEA